MSETESDVAVHTHSHAEVDVPISRSHQRTLVSCVLVVVVLAVIGLIITWPSPSEVSKASKQVRQSIDFAEAQYAAVVDSRSTRVCDGQDVLPKNMQKDCLYVLFDVTSREVGVREGVPCKVNQPYLKDSSKKLRYCVEQSFDPEAKQTPDFHLGDKVSLSYRGGEEIDGTFRYQYADQDRRVLIVVVIILFLVAVVAFGALRGLLAVAGLVVSLLIIGFYILPALVIGENGLLVALTGGVAVAAAALYLAHGFHNSTHIAFLSSIGSVCTIALLAELFFSFGRFSGFVSEEAGFLSASGSHVDLGGLLIAGVILASLGALDDMTVTQVAAVSELHNARPDYTFSHLWASAVRIGRDHVASTVNTLALAYVGTSLAVMVLFVISDLSLQWIANSEMIAVEIVGALVGSIGLIVAVPLATALAAYIVHSSGEHTHEHHEGHEVRLPDEA